MSELTIINHEGTLVVDSREVAEMVDKQHKDLMRDIRGYIAALEIPNERNFAPVEFFIESTYQDSKSETRPCYLLTRKGCDMVSNKMTGEKGIRFSAAYIDRFYAMETALQNPAPRILSPLEQLQLQVEIMRKMEERQDTLEASNVSINKRMDSIGEIITLSPNDWRRESKDMITKIACAIGGVDYIREVNSEIYRLMDERFAVRLKIRLSNMQRIAAENGMCKSKRDKLNYLDVIAEDKKLIEAYVMLVKELAIKNGVDKQSA